MSKLQDIYQRAYNNTPAATVDDNTVGEAVREQIEREKSRAGGTLSEDEWSDLVCLGTSYGQAQGFESGFRYALALIFESLIKAPRCGNTTRQNRNNPIHTIKGRHDYTLSCGPIAICELTFRRQRKEQAWQRIKRNCQRA